MNRSAYVCVASENQACVFSQTFHELTSLEARYVILFSMFKSTDFAIHFVQSLNRLAEKPLFYATKFTANWWSKWQVTKARNREYKMSVTTWQIEHVTVTCVTLASRGWKVMQFWVKKYVTQASRGWKVTQYWVKKYVTQASRGWKVTQFWVKK